MDVETRVVERAREALDTFRYDPPAWSGRQLLVLAAILVIVPAIFYWTGRAHGSAKQAMAFEAQMTETVKRVKAEDEARIATLQGELAETRAKAEAERARVASAESRLMEALEEASRAPTVKVVREKVPVEVCEAPTDALNKVIREVNNARR